MDLVRQANNIYHALKNQAGALETIQARMRAVSLELAMGKSRLEVTSWTFDGQSAAGSVRLSLGEQLDLLRRVEWCLENSAEVVPNRSAPNFG